MADIAYAADLHLDNYRAWGGEMVAGTNARARLTLGVLQSALALAKKQGAARFALLGDTFNRHNPNPQLVAALASVLVNSGLEIHLLVGNHDAASEEPGDHALAPLAHVPCCHVHDQPTVVGDVLFVPFRKAPVREWIVDVLEHGRRRGCTTLAAHFGIVTQQTPSFLVNAPDAYPVNDLSVRLSHAGFRFAVLGNWHYPENWRINDTVVWQCGTLCPHSFGDPHGGKVVFPGSATTDMTTDMIINAPTFTTIDMDRNAPTQDTRPSGGGPHVFLRLKNVPRDREMAVREQFERLTLGGLDIELAPTPSSSLASAIGNARKTRAELLGEYVERTLEEEPVPVREGVRGKLVEYKVL